MHPIMVLGRRSCKIALRDAQADCRRRHGCEPVMGCGHSWELPTARHSNLKNVRHGLVLEELRMDG